MFVNSKALLAIAACAVVARAQSSNASSTTSTAPASQSSLPAGIDTCILGCVTVAAASNGCVSFSNLTCVCTSSAFQQAAAACLQANCTASDVAAATQLQTQECASLSSGSASASMASSTGSSTGSSSASMTTLSSGASSASSSPSATSTSAAMGLSVPFSFGSLVGTLVASAGVLVGAAFIL